MKIELIYHTQCPNVETARHHLAEALKEVGLPKKWTEWNQTDASSPEFIRRFGSPSILIDGQDIAGVSPGDAVGSCRLYQGVNGLEGVPPVETIASALAEAMTKRRGWCSLATAPAVIVGILPNVTCPACWPIYAALLGSVGMGFLMERAYLLPLIVAFLILAVGSLAISAPKRHGYGPFWMAVGGSALLLSGKFLFAQNAAVYGGIGLLIAASLWNAWPVPKRRCCAARYPIGVSVERVELNRLEGRREM